MKVLKTWNEVDKAIQVGKPPSWPVHSPTPQSELSQQLWALPVLPASWIKTE